MVFEHDFKKFPELTNQQLQVFGFTSPHVQITGDFYAEVVKVIDGDTVRLRTNFRDFDFPLRLLGIDAPELNEGGQEAKDYVKRRCEGEEVQVLIDPQNRVDKFGRLLGKLFKNGTDIGDDEIRLLLALPFERRFEGQLPNMNKELRVEKWL